MKWVMMAIMLTILQFLSHQAVLNQELETADEHRMIYALQLAAQDAVQEVEPNQTANGVANQYGNGEVVFNQTSAIATFKSTLAENLNLNSSTLQPNAGTLLSTAPIIESETFLDGSNTTFPTTYTNTTYNINNLPLYSPSIVFIVQFTIPSYAAGLNPFTIDVPVVQSYQYSNQQTA